MPKKKVEEKKSFDKSKIIIIVAPLIIIACIIFSVKTIKINKMIIKGNNKINKTFTKDFK